MKIRFTRPQEEALVRRLWVEGFGEPQPYTDWYFRSVFRPELTLGLWQGDALAACLQIAPYQLMLGDLPCPAAYLVGVVTGSDFRRQGFGRALLNRALEELSRAGYVMAMLYTDIPDFYTPLGFVSCYQLRPQTFGPKKSRIPTGWRLTQRTAEDLMACQRIYRCMTKEWNGWLLRTPANWRNYTDDFLCDGGGLWLSDSAYLLWLPEKDCLRIQEIGYCTPEALEEAITVSRHLAAEKGYKTIRWSAPLPAPQLGEAQPPLPHVMCRRLDLPPTFSPQQVAGSTLAKYLPFAETNWVNEIT